MRKIKLSVIALLIMVSALCLTACNETGDKQLESIYDKYITYTEENGKETLYYEEWLEANGLEFGKNGKTAYEIYKEKNDFDGDAEDWEYYLITGLKPQSHFINFISYETKIPSMKVTPVKDYSLPKPERQGSVFKGWYLNGTKFEDNTAIDKDVTLSSLWQTENGEIEYTETENGAIITAYKADLTVIEIPYEFGNVPVCSIRSGAFNTGAEITEVKFVCNFTEYTEGMLAELTSLKRLIISGKG